MAHERQVQSNSTDCNKFGIEYRYLLDNNFYKPELNEIFWRGDKLWQLDLQVKLLRKLRKENQLLLRLHMQMVMNLKNGYMGKMT